MHRYKQPHPSVTLEAFASAPSNERSKDDSHLLPLLQDIEIARNLVTIFERGQLQIANNHHTKNGHFGEHSPNEKSCYSEICWLRWPTNLPPKNHSFDSPGGKSQIFKENVSECSHTYDT